jgi:hypothetical protein
MAAKNHVVIFNPPLAGPFAGPLQVPIIPVKDPPDPSPKTPHAAPIAPDKPAQATPKSSSGGGDGTRNRAR